MNVFSQHFFAMHTRFAMVFPGVDEEKGDELAKGVKQRVEHWEQCLSGFRSGAELQMINELAAERELPVSESLGRVLDTCMAYHAKTKGLFDPAVNEGLSSWADVIWDSDRRTLRFGRPLVKLDMGGIGKGIALDDVVSYLHAEGVRDAFLSFGESSIAGMGKHPHGDGWLVGEGDGFLLRDEFISVSGIQHLRGSVGDHTGAHAGAHARAHIYHPLKAELIRKKRKVMVKCASATEAEVLSTCAYLSDDEEFEYLKNMFPFAEWRLE